LDNVEALAPVSSKPTGSCYRISVGVFEQKLIDRLPSTPAKDSAATSPHEGGPATAVERKPEGQGAQHRTDSVVLIGEGTLENSVAEIDEVIFLRLSCIGDPAFNSNAKITMEEVFGVDTTAPGVIRPNVAVLLPFV